MSELTTKIMDVNIDEIKVINRLRRDLGDIDGLAEDIKRRGLLHNVVVREEKGQFVLVSGERRLRALEQLGYTKIQVTVMYDMDKETAIETEIAENVQSKSFNRYELVLSGAMLEEIEKAKAKKRQKAGVTLDNGVAQGRTNDIVARILKIGSKEQYRRYKIIVYNKTLLTDEEFDGWCNCRDSEGFSTKRIYELVKKRHQLTVDAIANTPKDATQPVDASKSLKQWKGSFKSVTKSIQSTIESLQNTDVCIYDQYDAKINHELMAELESCLKKTQQLFEKINIMTIDKDGALFLDTSQIRKNTVRGGKAEK